MCSQTDAGFHTVLLLIYALMRRQRNVKYPLADEVAQLIIWLFSLIINQKGIAALDFD
jgi:hypothetical protein